MDPSAGLEILELIRTRAMEYAPDIALFFAVVLGGIVLSALGRRLAKWGVRRTGLEALAERFGVAKLLYSLGIKRGLAHVVGSIVWFSGLLLTAATASEMLGIASVASGVAAIMGFLPRLFAALAVLTGGVALGGMLRRVVAGLGKKGGDLEEPDVLGNVVYYAVVAIAATVAAGQAGIETGLLESLMTTAVSLVLAGLALAFALGSRPSFTNLVAGHFFRRLARPGDRVTVGDISGVVLKYVGVSVLLRTDDGSQVAVPCERLLSDSVGLQRVIADRDDAETAPRP